MRHRTSKESVTTSEATKVVMVPRYRATVNVAWPAKNGASSVDAFACEHEHTSEAQAADCARRLATAIRYHPEQHNIRLLRCPSCDRVLYQEAGERANTITGRLICAVHGVIHENEET